LVSSASSVTLPREPEEQSNRDAEPKGSKQKPFTNIETDSPHHQETNRDKNSGKLLTTHEGKLHRSIAF
jgi:hypothetical protein